MPQSQIRKIAVVGNIAGGKTRLSHRLAVIHSVPLIHVDTLQFLPGMKIRPYAETRTQLLEIMDQTSWLIDGYGPLEIIEKRFQLADQIVFVDLPLWRHFWWLTKRQVTNVWWPRKELPAGCNEITWEHTIKLYKTLWHIHKKMRPELLRIFARENLCEKVCYVRSLGDWRLLFKQGL